MKNYLIFQFSFLGIKTMKMIIIYFLGLFLVACGPKTATNDFPPLFPFVISYDGPDNASSVAHLFEAPAGKHGFIRVENGRYVNNAGPVRLNGTGIAGASSFPSHSQADSLAARLARLGFNCIRLSVGDYGNISYPVVSPGLSNFDASHERLERLDYLIYALKKRGIYVVMPGGRYNFGRPGNMLELRKEYLVKLLTHVNPYTGLAYKDDPCVAVVEISNETSLFGQYNGGSIDQLPEPYASEFRKQWNNWLKKKYESTDALTKAWNSDTALLGRKQIFSKIPAQLNRIPDSKDTNVQQILPGENRLLENGTIPIVKAGSIVLAQAKRDFYQFLVDTDHAYYLSMYNFLKNDLKVKSLISGTQLFYSPPHNQAELDFIDFHYYWCHPKPFDSTQLWRVVNKSMVNSMNRIQVTAAQRIFGKPFTVSEYNHPFPNQYGAEGPLMVCSYGRFQAWDWVSNHNYNWQSDFEPDKIVWFFTTIARTDVLAHLPACAAIFVRGDVQEGKSTIVAPMDYTRYFDNLTKTNQVEVDIETAGFDMRQTMLHKTAVDLTGKSGTDTASVEKIAADKKVFISDTGELTWNIEQPDAGYFTVNTPNTKVFTGFPKDRKVMLGDVTVAIGKTRLGWATVSLVSRNATGFGESGNPASILLAATGISENKGMSIQHVEEPATISWWGDVEDDGKITLNDGHFSKANQWGEGPVYVEGVPAIVTLPADPGKTKCYALDPGGNRKEEIPVAKANGGGSKIVLKPEYETVWYEIDIQ